MKTTLALRRSNIPLVDRYIQTFGRSVTIGRATAEEFDEYIYSILDNLYIDKEIMVKTQEQKFNLDWSSLTNRIHAMNILHEINRRRKAGPINLFVDQPDETE